METGAKERATTVVGDPGSTVAMLPFGIGSAYAFAILNGLSSQVVLGSPVVLYARLLGASATVLGIVAGMMPLLVIFQLAGAPHVARAGYKRFMARGWSTRVAFIFVLSLVPLSAGFLNETTRLSIVLLILFLFNLARGISSCAWLPWITGLVPAALRGRYLTLEQLCVNLAGAVAFAVSAAVLGGHAVEARFAIVFLLSGLAGVFSLRSLHRIPDVAPPHEETSASGPVPWLELSAYPPFRRLLWVNLVWAIAYGGLLPFIADYLRGSAGMGDSGVLVAMVAFFVGGMGSMWMAGARLDRLGSRPALILTVLMCFSLTAGWFVQAAGVVKPRFGLALFLLFMLGLANAVFLSATNRLAMLTAPKMGRSHFFALFSVVLNLTLGMAPVLWGLVLDAIGGWHARLAGLDWNRYSLFFLLVLAAYGASLVTILRLKEDRAARLDTLLHELLVSDPRRAIARLFT